MSYSRLEPWVTLFEADTVEADLFEACEIEGGFDMLLTSERFLLDS
jgi:hypothetical protein